MSSTFDQFTVLQNALQQLNYSQPLLRASVPLVHALLTDLVEITRKYQQVKQQSIKLENEFDIKLNPLKRENANLTKANNDLHLKIINENEEQKRNLSKFEKQIQEFRQQRNEMNFLLKQKTLKMESQEINISQMKKRLNVLCTNSSATAKLSIFRGAMTDMVDEEEKQPLFSPIMSSNATDSASALALLKNENCALLAQVKQLARDYDSEHEISVQLERNIAKRDSEIQRLHKSMNNTTIDQSKMNILSTKYSAEDQKLRMKHQLQQISVLECELKGKENECLEMKNKLETNTEVEKENVILMEKNEIAFNELSLLKQKMSNIKMNNSNKKVNYLRSTSTKLSMNLNEIQILRKQITQLTKLNKNLENKLERKQKQWEISQEKMKHVTDNKFTLDLTLDLKQKEIENIRNENQILIRNTNELKAKQINLKHESEMKTHENENLKLLQKSLQTKFEYLKNENCKLKKNGIEIQSEMKELQKMNENGIKDNQNLMFDKKQYIHEIFDLNEKLSNNLTDKKSIVNNASIIKCEHSAVQKRLQNMEFSNIDLKNENNLISKQVIEYHKKLQNLQQKYNELQFKNEKNVEILQIMKIEKQSKEFDINLLNKKICNLETLNVKNVEKIDSLNVENTDFQLSKNSSSQIEIEFHKTLNMKNNLEHKNVQLENNLHRKIENNNILQKENTDMKILIQQIQSQMVQLQNRIQILTNDRDHENEAKKKIYLEFENQTENINDMALKINHQQLQQIEHRNKFISLVKNNEQLKKEMQLKIENISDLNARLLKFSEIQKSNNQQLQITLHDKKHLQIAHDILCKEKNETLDELHSLKLKYEQLINKYSDMEQNQNLLSAKNNELKVLCQQLDENMKYSQKRIQELYSENELLINTLNNERLKSENIYQNNQELNLKMNELHLAMKNIISKMDDLQMEYDSKVEIIYALQKSLTDEKQTKEELNRMICNVQQQHQQQQRILIGKENELNRTLQTLHKMHENMEQLKCGKHIIQQQLSQTSLDMENLSKENAFLNQQYSQTVTDRDTKHKELQTIVDKLIFYEQKIIIMSREKNEILNNYKSVCSENERFCTFSENMNKEKTEYRLKICSMNEQIIQRDCRIKMLEKQASEFRISNHVLERQSLQLSRDLERSNSSMMKNQNISQTLLQDLEMKHQLLIDDKQAICVKDEMNQNLKQQLIDMQNIITQLELDRKVSLDTASKTNDKTSALEKIIQQLRISHLSNKEKKLREMDGANQLKSELNEMKQLNDRLQIQLHKMQK